MDELLKDEISEHIQESMAMWARELKAHSVSSPETKKRFSQIDRKIDKLSDLMKNFVTTNQMEKMIKEMKEDRTDFYQAMSEKINNGFDDIREVRDWKIEVDGQKRVVLWLFGSGVLMSFLSLIVNILK